MPRGLTRLTPADLDAIREALQKPYWGINSALAKKYDVTEKTIRKIRNGEYKV